MAQQGKGGTVETETCPVYLLISVIDNGKVKATIKLEPDTAATVLADLADDPRAGPGVLLNKAEANIRKSERKLQPDEGPFKYLLKHGGASSSGQAGAGVGAGATRSVRPTVPLLRPAPDIHKWCFRFEGLPPDQPAFFLDASGQLSSALEVWVKQNTTRFRNGTALRPLLITGPIKAGKSFTLNKVLPAIAVEFASANSLPEPTFLAINCERVSKDGGSSKCLSSLLANLVSAAKAAGLQQAADTPQPRDVLGGDVLTTLQDFMDRLPRDRINYLLLDEVQKMYLLLDPTAPAAQSSRVPPLNFAGIMNMRECMKTLLLNSPPWVAWGITGSAMATLLANVALTPANGTALLLDNYRVVLPGAVDTELMQVAWAQLQKHYNDQGIELPAELVWCAPPNHAMLAYMCYEWTLRQSHVSTANELVQDVKLTKLMPEALLDLRLVLEMLPESRLLEVLLAITDPTAGVPKAALPRLLLGPLTAFGAEDASDSGRLIIDNPLYTELLRLITTEDGKLIRGVLDGASIPAVESFMYRQLVVLGELCTSRHELVNQLMATMAKAMSMDTEDLTRQLWFRQVLNSKENNVRLKNAAMSAAESFNMARSQNAHMEPCVALSWFHRLQRHVLVHGDLNTQRQLLGSYPKPLSAFIEDGRVSNVLTHTFAAKQLPGAIDKKQTPTKSLLGAAKQQRVPVRCALVRAGASSQACVPWR